MSRDADTLTRQRLLIGGLLAVAYVATIIAANWAIQNLGRPPAAPGAPYTIPVWPGLEAPSGVLFAGLAFTFRDLTQEWLGRRAVVIAIGAGAVASWVVGSGRIAVASGIAFLVSELADFAVYTPLRERRWLLAVGTSNLVGLVIDSALFLWIAFGSLDFIRGQVVGKIWMTLLAVVLLLAFRRWVIPWRSRPADEPTAPATAM
jgi:queuosine precursor transporter